MKRAITFIVLIFCFLTLLSVACDPGYADEIYLSNSLSEPITYRQISAKDSILATIVIQPGESKFIVTVSDMGSSNFDDNIDYFYDFFKYIQTQTITFNDGTVLSWNHSCVEYNGNFNFEEMQNHKYPLWKKYWKILSEKEKKYSSFHIVEYSIDEEDYQTALYLQTQDSLTTLNK